MVTREGRIVEELVGLAVQLEAVGRACGVVDQGVFVRAPEGLDVSGLDLDDLCCEEVAAPVWLHQGGTAYLVEVLARKGSAALVVFLDRTYQYVGQQTRLEAARRGARAALAGATAREMNDAVTIVQGRLELLLELATDSGGFRRHGVIALEYCERMANALHNLRMVGTSDMPKRGTMVGDVVRRAVAEVLPGTDIEVEVQPADLQVLGEERVIRGVLAGMLRLVLAGDGGAVVARTDGEFVEFRFRTAPGVKASDVVNIPFGIVRILVLSLGGQIVLDGAAVLLTLPRVLPPAGLMPRDAVVLAVGDQEFVLGIRSLLEPDIPVHECSSAEAAAPLLGTGDFYGAVVQLGLPRRSGLWLARTAERPVVVVYPSTSIAPVPGIRCVTMPVGEVRLLRALIHG